MKGSDPTLLFLHQLEDSALYAQEANVPVFVPHKRKVLREDGSEHLVEVTEADLPEIAAEANQRLTESGVPGLMTLGHRQSKAAEVDQPPVVGFVRDFAVGTFGPKRKPCITVSKFTRRDCEEEAKKYPFRSVDYYPGTKQITGVALLKRDPQLDMGVVMSYGGHGLLVRYLKEVEAMEPDPTKAPMSPEEGMDGADDDMQDEEYRKHCYSHPHAEQYHKKMCAQYGMAMPSGTNTPPPGGPPPALPPAAAPPPLGEEAERMQRDSLAIKYARLEGEVAELRKSRNREVSERQVIQLEAEGYHIPDRAKEVAKMALLSDAERYERVKEIRDCYSRDPAAGRMLPVEGDVEPPEAGNNKPQRSRPLDPSDPASRNFGGTEYERKVNQYLKSHIGAEYEEAVAYAKGEIPLTGTASSNGNGRHR